MLIQRFSIEVDRYETIKNRKAVARVKHIKTFLKVFSGRQIKKAFDCQSTTFDEKKEGSRFLK